jgi:hypothetical protein
MNPATCSPPYEFLGARKEGIAVPLGNIAWDIFQLAKDDEWDAEAEIGLILTLRNIVL